MPKYLRKNPNRVHNVNNRIRMSKDLHEDGKKLDSKISNIIDDRIKNQLTDDVIEKHIKNIGLEEIVKKVITNNHNGIMKEMMGLLSANNPAQFSNIRNENFSNSTEQIMSQLGSTLQKVFKRYM